MDSMTIIAVASIIMAGLTISIGSIGPSLAEGKAVATALNSLAQQPDASATITRTLFVGLAMIESISHLLLRSLDDSNLRQPVLEPRHHSSRRRVSRC